MPSCAASNLPQPVEYVLPFSAHKCWGTPRARRLAGPFRCGVRHAHMISSHSPYEMRQTQAKARVNDSSWCKITATCGLKCLADDTQNAVQPSSAILSSQPKRACVQDRQPACIGSSEKGRGSVSLLLLGEDVRPATSASTVNGLSLPGRGCFQSVHARIWPPRRQFPSKSAPG